MNAKEFEGYKVLLADDEEIAREIVANIVEDLGAECITARDGNELLEKLNGPGGENIDLVLTDINMPGKGGIEACSEFRASAHPKAKKLPIIGISADTNPAIFDNAISAGMNGMTMKPLSRETLHAHFHITLKDNRANEVFCERIQQGWRCPPKSACGCMNHGWRHGAMEVAAAVRIRATTTFHGFCG